jgi:hypothetical protein
MTPSVKALWRRELLRRALTLPDVPVDEALAAVELVMQEHPTPPAGDPFLRTLPGGMGAALSILDAGLKDLQPCVDAALSMRPEP